MSITLNLLIYQPQFKTGHGISLSSLCDTQECLLHCWYCLLKFFVPFLTFVQMSVSGNISEVMEEANQSCCLNCMAKGMGSGEILAINTDGSWSGLLLSSFSTVFLLACLQLLIEALSVITLSVGEPWACICSCYAILPPKKYLQVVHYENCFNDVMSVILSDCQRARDACLVFWYSRSLCKETVLTEDSMFRMLWDYIGISDMLP